MGTDVPVIPSHNLRLFLHRFFPSALLSVPILIASHAPPLAHISIQPVTMATARRQGRPEPSGVLSMASLIKQARYPLMLRYHTTTDYLSRRQIIIIHSLAQ